MKIKESKVSAATKLIEFVKKGMNAQQAIDKILVSEARVTMMGVGKVAEKAAEAFTKKYRLTPNSHISRDKLQDFLGNFTSGIDPDDQEVVDAFFEKTESALEGMGYKVR